MIARAASAALSVGLAASLLAGCASDPEPAEPTPLFASEEEAFAAAEATYRAYVDAVNDRRNGAPIVADPQDYLAGAALEIDIETLRRLHELKLTIQGSTTVGDIRYKASALAAGTVAISVCLDSSSTRVLDEYNNDVTPPDRKALTRTAVGFVHTGEQLVITDTEVELEGEC